MNPGDRYATLLRALVREEPLLRVPRELTELELQAHWFAGDFGREFTHDAGEAVRVVQFGVWNREAGPDFAEAAVSLDGGEPRARLHRARSRRARLGAARARDESRLRIASCCTSSRAPAAASFSPAPRSIAMCRKSCSISPRSRASRRLRCPRRSSGAAPGRCASCPRKKRARFCSARRSFACGAKAAALARLDGIARRGRGALPGARRDARLQEQQAALHAARPAPAAAAAAQGRRRRAALRRQRISARDDLARVRCADARRICAGCGSSGGRGGRSSSGWRSRRSSGG